MLQMADVREKYGLPADEEILAGLDEGATLPASFYYAPEMYALEQEKIFARSWQYACHESAVAKPGDYAVTKAGSTPIIVTHGKDGRLRGFVNVCRTECIRSPKRTGTNHYCSARTTAGPTGWTGNSRQRPGLSVR